MQRFEWYTTMGRLDVVLSNIRWLSCILIGCIFYGVVKIYLFFKLLIWLNNELLVSEMQEIKGGVVFVSEIQV